MKTLDANTFEKHLATLTDPGRQLNLIVNSRSCQWMTDTDTGHTWLDNIYDTPREAIDAMRAIQTRVQKLPTRDDNAFSARIIF